MPSDRNFDDIAQRFTHTIYANPKGKLRLLGLQQDFLDLEIPLQGMEILDVGGGQGQFSLWLAEHGANIHLCDVSENMLEIARNNFNAANLHAEFTQCALQELPQKYLQKFDLILNHAVLEWLEAPFDALPLLVDRLKPGGYLSLMFYNRAGHQWRQIMNGGIDTPDESNPKLRREGNAPQQPLDPIEVEKALNALGFSVLRWRGIRCIHDHMHDLIRQRLGEEKIAKADLKYGLLEPFRQLGRYVHFVARRV